MELKLNIYKNSKEVEKTYIAETVDIMFGTIEDILGLIDGKSLDNTDDMLQLATGAIKELKPFLKEVFEGLTDEELRRTKLKELIPLFVDLFKYAIGELKDLGGEKN